MAERVLAGGIGPNDCVGSRCLAWLARQGLRSGFELLAAERHASGRIRAPQGRHARTITLNAVLFEGLLRVTDAQALCTAWTQGMGPGKAMGLGMLSLAPAASLGVVS